MMTPFKKIKPHATLDDLFATLKADRASDDILVRRYPVRFILLDDFCIFQKLAERAGAEGIVSVDLEKLLKEDDRDRWISQDEVLSVLKRGDSSTHFQIISPLSEIIRFYDKGKLRAFLHAAALMENAGGDRVYIPLIGLRQRFEDFLTHFGRIEESAPVWAVSGGAGVQPVKIFLLPGTEDAGAFDLPEEFDCQKSFYDWLRFWKTRAPTARAFFASEVLNAHYENAQPDNIFQITKIENARDFFEKVAGVVLPFEYKAEEDGYWQQLLLENDWNARRNFQQFVTERFNVKKLEADDLIENWLKPQTDDFGRWLLKNAATGTLQTNQPYLCSILAGNVDLHNGNALLGRIALGVADRKLENAILKERRQLLEKFPSMVPLSRGDETALLELVDKTANENFETALLLCTGRFCFECERFIKWFRDGSLSLERLNAFYPGMAEYLAPLDDAKMADYFAAYKIAKLRDEYTPGIKIHIETLNASEETFWQWHSQYKFAHDLLAEETAPLGKIYWLDGVGAEWLPLMLAKVKGSRFMADTVCLAAAKLPSMTANNRFDGDKIIKRDALDKFAHDSPYRYPYSICRELQIVGELMDEILSETAWQRIAIVSDHGLTALSRLLDGRNYTKNAAHEGREEEVATQGAPDGDYLFTRAANGKHYRVALKHVSLGAKPVREVHGGCSPEEVLVPFVVISRQAGAIPTVSRRKDKVAVPPADAQTQPTGTAKRGFEEDELF
jgi:hypothetical protein